MAGNEYFGADERKEINDVLETGILFRYNHDAQRNNIWKAREFEAEVAKLVGAKYAHAVSSGSTAVSCALAAAGIGAGDEVIGDENTIKIPKGGFKYGIKNNKEFQKITFYVNNLIWELQ